MTGSNTFDSAELEALEEREAIQSVETDQEWNFKYPEYSLLEQPSSDVSLNGKQGPVDFAGIEARDPAWILHHHLARGHLTLLAGDGGVGKTKLLLDLACHAAQGDAFLGKKFERPMRVLLYLGESIVEEEKKYLDQFWGSAARVPLKRIFVKDNKITIPELLEYCDTCDIDIVGIDPFSHLQASESTNNNLTVERDLRALADPIEALGRKGPACILVHHLRKNKSEGSVTDAVLGAVKYGAVSRMVLIAGRPDPKVIEVEGLEPDTRVLMRAKSNLGPTGGGQYYRIPLSDGYATIEWGALLARSADEIIGGNASITLKRDHALQDMIELLKGYNEPVKTGAIQNKLNDTHSHSTIKRAIKTARERGYISGGRSGYQVTQSGMTWLNRQS